MLAFVLAVTGFLAATQVRNVLLIRQHLQIPSTRLEELAVLLKQQELRRARLETQLEDLRLQLVESERAAIEGQTSLIQMNRQLRNLRMLAGLLSLEGPGIVVEMRDNPAPLRPGDDPNKTILHYSDIHAVINDLWAAGAEAIAVNEERIITRTGVNCVGTTILCNTKRIAPPYRIVAIGDSAAMVAYLRRPYGPVQVLQSFGFPVKIEALARVAVSAYRGTASFHHAAPAQGSGGPARGGQSR